MAGFRFKQFTVRQDASALKVGTDAVLLGAAMTLRESDRAMLDVGTGTGVIALMTAQRIAALGAAPIIIAIDIDGPSAAEAAANFAASPWPGMLSARHCALRDFAPAAPLDVIFSNPPYYDESLPNPDAREAAARHTCSLSYRELCAFAARHLAPAGRLSLILPSDCEQALVRTAASFGLHPFRILRIRTTDAKPPRRIVAEFSRDAGPALTETLTLMSGSARTAEYSLLTSDFYL